MFGNISRGSIQEIVARKARLIHHIAKLRADAETMHDAMIHLNALRSKVKRLRSENRARIVKKRSSVTEE